MQTRGLLPYALAFAAFGCGRKESDVLREFPPPRPITAGADSPARWQLVAVQPSRVEVQLGANRTSSIFEVIDSALAWSARPTPELTATLTLRLAANHAEDEALWQQAWGATPQRAVAGDAKFVLLEFQSEDANSFDLNAPGEQHATLRLRGELESHGVRAELSLRARVDVLPAQVGSDSARLSRTVRATCDKPLLVDLSRYHLALPDPRRVGHLLETASVGCSLTFQASAVALDNAAVK